MHSCREYYLKQKRVLKQINGEIARKHAYVLAPRCAKEDSNSRFFFVAGNAICELATKAAMYTALFFSDYLPNLR